jgi:hypothetical protein
LIQASCVYLLFWRSGSKLWQLTAGGKWQLIAGGKWQ